MLPPFTQVQIASGTIMNFTNVEPSFLSLSFFHLFSTI